MQKAIFCNLKGAFSDDEKPYKAAIEQYLPYQNALYSRTIYTKTDAPDTMETSKTTTLHEEQQNTVEKCVDNHVENRWKKMWI